MYVVVSVQCLSYGCHGRADTKVIVATNDEVEGLVGDVPAG